MNALIHVRTRSVHPADVYDDLVQILGGVTRREAVSVAKDYAKYFRRVNIQLLPTHERIEWRDGKRVKGIK